MSRDDLSRVKYTLAQPTVNQHIHDHDLGLQHDMKFILGRRKALSWFLASGATALIAGCNSDDVIAAATGSGSSGATGGGATGGGTTTTGDCVADAEETAGPYPADGSNTANGSVANVLNQSGVVRSDMRSSFGSFSGTAEGVDLVLTLTVVDAANGCTPLADHAVYLWHADAVGRYSIYDLPSENYLRAVGVTDANGEVTFTTVFPGCYAGRYPHMHLEVYPTLDTTSSYRNKILTGQIAMPENECAAVYDAISAYSQSAGNFARVSLGSDNIFGNNTSAQLAQQTPDLTGNPNNGYTGSVLIGV